MRGQANLIALATAIVVLSGALVAGLAIVDGAFGDADRDATERGTAVELAETLVRSDSSLATRRNVLDATRTQRFDGERLADRYPSLSKHDVEIALDGDVLARTGEGRTGTTVRRIVLVEERQSAAWTPSIEGTEPAVTLPRRTDRAILKLSPPAGTSMTTVRVDGRVELRNESGLAGEYEVPVSRLTTATLSFEADGELTEGDVTVEYFPTRTRSAILEVSVDA